MANNYTANRRVFRGVLLMYEHPELVKVIRDYQKGGGEKLDRRGFQQRDFDDVLRARKWAELCTQTAERREAKQ